MKHVVKIEFQGLQDQEVRHAIEARARSKAAKLERDVPGLEDCRIAVVQTSAGMPPHASFTVSIEIAAHGTTLRYCALDEDEVFTALRGAFDGIRLALGTAMRSGEHGAPGSAAFVASKKGESLTEEEDEASMPHMRWDG